MTRHSPQCDRDMISSPDDIVVNNRSSTEDHVLSLSRDMSVTDHHTPELAVRREPIVQDQIDAEPSVQSGNLLNNHDAHMRSHSFRMRPMSSKVYNPLPFKKRFMSAALVEDLAGLSEIVSPRTNETIMSVNTQIAKRVSPTSPRMFSPVPYSRHCSSYSPINWQNPSTEEDHCESLDIEDKPIDDGSDRENPTLQRCDEEELKEEILTESKCQEEVKSDNEHEIIAFKCTEEEKSTDQPISTENVGVKEESGVEEQKSIELLEADDERNPTESNSPDEWLIDQHSPVESRSLIDEWRSKRSEDYQNSLKRPLTVIPEEDVDSFSNAPLLNAQADESQCNTEQVDDCMDIKLPIKSPIRDSLEEFVQLEQCFIEEEKRRNEQLIKMKSNEGSELINCSVDTEVKKPKNIIAKVMNQLRVKRSSNDKDTKKNIAVKENKDTEGSEETEELKKTFEEHLKEKEEFEMLIKKQEEDLKGQLSEMDKVMEAVHSEHADLEKVTGDFVNTMKFLNSYKKEADYTRAKNAEQGFNLGILQSENSDLEKELRELYDNIEEIKERRSEGLQSLKQRTDEMKRETEMLKNGNNEIDASTKQKMCEFNKLRMTVMEKGITYVKKGTLVKGTGKVRLPDVLASESQSVETPKKLSSGLALDLRDIDNVPPDIGSPRCDTPEVNGTGKLSKYDSEQYMDEEDKSVMPARQMSAIELVRLPGARNGCSKIPKPIVHPYGRASRDSERYTVSDKDYTKMTLSSHYKRNNFMPEDERHVIKPTLCYINPDIELRRLKGDESQCNTEQVDDCMDIELPIKSPLRDSLEEFVQLEKYFIEAEKRRNEQLIKMKSNEGSELIKCSEDTEIKKPKNIIAKVMNQFRVKRSSKDMDTKKNIAVKENKDTEGSEETVELKKTFDEHLKEKEQFEMLIKKQEADLKGQLSEMDEVMGAVHSEHADLEQVTGDFADTMKFLNSYKKEADYARTKNAEQGFNLGILQSENSDLEKELRELYDNIEEIKEGRSEGLQSLKQRTDEMKRETEMLKNGNNEIDASTKQKMGEFNKLRMTVMEKGITYVKKGTLVKGTGKVRLPDVLASGSPSLETPKKLSSDLALDLTNIDNVPPDIWASRCDTPKVNETGELSKYDSEQYMDEKDKSVMPARQMSAIELVRLPGARDGRSKIPKPIVHPYGSASRDSERYTVSDKDYTKMTLSRHYKRNNFVPEDERHVIKPTLCYINPEIELRRLKGLSYQTDNGDFTGRYGRNVTGYDGDMNSVDEDIRELNRTHHASFADAKRNIPQIKKQTIVPKRIPKKDIKSKIDTGLKNRPVNQKKNIPSNRKESKKANASVKRSQVKNTSREPSSVKCRTQTLPPLKNVHNECDMPRSPSFGNKPTLPMIQPTKQQNKNKIPQKKAAPCRVLPPIKPSNACRLPDIKRDNEPLKVTSQKQAPKAIWISFSPTPPINGVRSTRRTRTPDSNRSNQDDNKRVPHGRA